MASPARAVRWYSSFYWRIGISFVVFVVVVLVGQSLMVGYARASGAFAPGNPNAAAAAIAAELGAALSSDPALDLSRFLAQQRPGPGPSTYIVMADGRVAAFRVVLQGRFVEDVGHGGKRSRAVHRQNHRRTAWRHDGGRERPGRTAFVVTLTSR